MEVPSISASCYATSVLDHKQLFGGDPFGQRLAGQKVFDAAEQLKAIGLGQFAPQPNQPNQEKAKMANAARIVKVFIADPNENIPLEKRVLYSGDEKLTDLTDQELFFEVPIAELLAKHNETRKATVDKTQAEKFGRDIFLEPARIRDLKMVVVTVAQF